MTHAKRIAGVYYPPPGTIRRVCAEIREKWSERTHATRAPHLKRVDFGVPGVNDPELGRMIDDEWKVIDEYSVA